MIARLSFWSGLLVMAVAPPVLAQPAQPAPADPAPAAEAPAAPAAADEVPPPSPAADADAEKSADVDVPPPETTSTATLAEEEISVPDWDADDWLLVKPRLSMLDLTGYFRLRGDLLRTLDFGNRSVERYLPLAEGNPDDGQGNSARVADYTYANLRLRLQPTINVTENIHVHTTFDILDNLILGSSADSVPINGIPLNLISRSQNATSQGFNAVADSIQVKHAWAQITALNETLELRVGRMPNHWGLGMLVNEGSCLDCDSGDVVDRITLSFRAVGHVFTPAFDLISSGPQLMPFGRVSHPVDAVEWDDVEQYSAKVEKRSTPAQIKDALAHDEWAINYGAWVLWRRQSRDVPYEFYLVDPTDPTGATDYNPVGPVEVQQTLDDTTNPSEVNRNANLVTADLYAEFYWKTFRAALEGAFIYGEFDDLVFPAAGRQNPGPLRHQIIQWGLALELSYRLEGDYSGVRIDLNAGIASGDKAPGFGALDRAAGQKGDFGAVDPDDPTREVYDTKLENFQFSPNYHIDLLLYRQIIGTVTDSWYVSPGVSYDFDQNINIQGNVTFASALYKRSTPSCNGGCPVTDPDLAVPSRLLGVEIDAEVSYGLFAALDGNMVRAAVQGGVLFPLDGFRNPLEPDDEEGAAIAWTLQARMYVTF